MDFASKIVCALCNNTPDIVVESTCCGDIYCWKCVKDVKFSCYNCQRELRSNCFVVNQPVQQLIDKAKTPSSISSFYCPLNCGFSIAGMTTLQEHFQFNCQNWYVACSRCGLSIKRHEMPSHSQVCQVSQVVDCEYAKYGCKHMVAPDKMGEHIREYARSHLALLTTAVKSFEEDTQVPASPINRRSSMRLSTQIDPAVAITTPSSIEQTQSPVASPAIALVQIENYCKNVVNNVSTYVSSNAASYHPVVVSSTNWIAKFLGDGLPLLAKVGIFLLLLMVLKGPLFFVFRLLILAFTCFASYNFLSTTSIFANPTTHPYVFGIYAMYVLYIIPALL